MSRGDFDPCSRDRCGAAGIMACRLQHSSWAKVRDPRTNASRTYCKAIHASCINYCRGQPILFLALPAAQIHGQASGTDRDNCIEGCVPVFKACWSHCADNDMGAITVVCADGCYDELARCSKHCPGLPTSVAPPP
ncbi:uncharacterized protein LOC121052892 isoform X2 [Rosa chinensis]|uniref:uncharacterized protein LOC121052892 isoform X2 n=1 Tax=Rosa chinensis TaxID=74649 RepID=UPI001AD94148|nr:uncharacterized protein LOC121052892 isoform X2 [Rosa chinensis]